MAFIRLTVPRKRFPEQQYLKEARGDGGKIIYSLPCRPHSGQQQPFLYGLTARCNSLSRFSNQNWVIFRSFRRKILLSNFRLLTGFSSFLSTASTEGMKPVFARDFKPLRQPEMLGKFVGKPG